VSVSDDGSTIATGSIDNQVHVFNRQGLLLGAYQTKSPIKSRSVAVSGEGLLIVAADLSNVYGFSRSLSTGPDIAPGPEVTGNLSTGTAGGNTTIVSTTTGASIQPLLPGNASGAATRTTPSSGFPWILTLVPIVLIIAARKMK
jgi:hypothetical protein